MTFLKQIISALSKVKLPDINLIKNEDNSTKNITIETLVLGDQKYTVENGILTLGDNTELKLIKKNDKFEALETSSGTRLSSISENKEFNVAAFNIQEKVFTRADLAPTQLPLLTIEDEHEKLIKQLKPYLEEYHSGNYLGCLLITSTIIRMEDNKSTKKTIQYYHTKLADYGKDAHTIYNLFRSGIMQREIIPHLQSIEKSYSSHEERKKQFLIYWYAILKQ